MLAVLIRCMIQQPMFRYCKLDQLRWMRWPFPSTNLDVNCCRLCSSPGCCLTAVVAVAVGSWPIRVSSFGPTGGGRPLGRAEVMAVSFVGGVKLVNLFRLACRVSHRPRDHDCHDCCVCLLLHRTCNEGD